MVIYVRLTSPELVTTGVATS